MCHTVHGGGALKVGSDGFLYLSTGDGADWSGVDIGDPNGRCSQLIGPAQETGARRAQQTNSLAGKLLRVDAESGLGIAENPFFDGEPHSPSSRIFSLGLRNPFRFTLQENGNSPPVPLCRGCWGGKIGRKLLSCTLAAMGDGPCFEGPVKLKEYYKNPALDSLCHRVGKSERTVFPLISWHRDKPRKGWLSGQPIATFTGHTATGIVFYNGTQFPERYHGALFFADHGEQWIKVLWVNDEHHLERIEDFAGINSPIGLNSVRSPVRLGSLIPPLATYCMFRLGRVKVRRIRYVGR